MGTAQSQAADQAGMAGQLVRAMVDRGSNEAVQFENLIKLKWLVASSTVESVHLRQLVYHTPNAINKEGANLFFATVYQLARAMHLVTAAERGEYVAFLVTRFSEVDSENEVQIVSGLPKCVTTLLAFGLNHAGKVTGATPFPLGLVLQLVEMYTRYPSFAIPFIQGPGQQYLCAVLGLELDVHHKAAAVAALVKMAKHCRLPLIMEQRYRHILDTMLESTLEQKTAAAELIAMFVEHAPTRLAALRNADMLLECDLLSALMAGLEEQFPNVVAARHPDVLTRVLKALAALAHGLVALTASETAVALLTQEVQTLVECLMTVAGADPGELELDTVEGWEGDPAEPFLQVKYFLTTLLLRLAQLHMAQDLLVDHSALFALLMSLESVRAPTPIVKDTNANALKALRLLTHSHAQRHTALLQEQHFPKLLDCLVMPGKANTIDALYVLEAALPVPLDYIDQGMLDILSQPLGGAITQALCWVLGPLLSDHVPRVEERHIIRLTLDLLLRLCAANGDLKAWVWEQVPLRELKEFLEFCEDVELRVLIARLVKTLFDVPAYQERLQAVGLLEIIRRHEEGHTPEFFRLTRTFSNPAPSSPAPQSSSGALSLWGTGATTASPQHPTITPFGMAQAGPPLLHPTPQSPSAASPSHPMKQPRNMNYPSLTHSSPSHSTPQTTFAGAPGSPHQLDRTKAPPPPINPYALVVAGPSYSSPHATSSAHPQTTKPKDVMTFLPLPPPPPLSAEQAAASKIQEFFRTKFNARPENWRRLRMTLYSDAIFEKLEMHEKVSRELTALYVTHQSYVASLAPIRVAGVILQPSRPNVNSAEQAASVALWRKLHTQDHLDEAQLAVLTEVTPAMVSTTLEETMDEGELLFYSGMATKIQRVMRGYWCRRELWTQLAPYAHLPRPGLHPRRRRVVGEMYAICKAAAIIIQRVWRGVLGRNAVWRAIVAAVAIQTQWRLYILRRPPPAKLPALPPPPVYPIDETTPALEPPTSLSLEVICDTAHECNGESNTSPCVMEKALDVIEESPSALPAIPREKAAARIQKAWRQHRAWQRKLRRMRYKREKFSPEAMALRAAAALVLQRCQRGKWGRQEAQRLVAVFKRHRQISTKYPTVRERMAVHVQRIYRGYRARQSVRKMITDRIASNQTTTTRHRQAQGARQFYRSAIGKRHLRLWRADKRETMRRKKEEERREVRLARFRAAQRQQALLDAERRVQEFEAAERKKRLLGGLAIQRVWRGTHVRLGVKRSKLAILKIQSIWRGYVVRRRLWEKNPQLNALPNPMPTLAELTSLAFLQPVLPEGIAPHSAASKQQQHTTPALPCKKSAGLALSYANESLVHHPHDPSDSDNCAFCQMWRDRGAQTRDRRQLERRMKKKSAALRGDIAAPLPSMAPLPATWLSKGLSGGPLIPADQLGVGYSSATLSPTPPTKKGLEPLRHVPAARSTSPPLDPLNCSLPKRPGSLPSLKPDSSYPDFMTSMPERSVNFDLPASPYSVHSSSMLLGLSDVRQLDASLWSSGLMDTGLQAADLRAFEQALIAMHEELQQTQHTLESHLQMTQAKQEELLKQQKALLETWSETISRCSSRPGSALKCEPTSWQRPMSAAEFRRALSDVLAAAGPVPETSKCHDSSHREEPSLSNSANVKERPATPPPPLPPPPPPPPHLSFPPPSPVVDVQGTRTAAKPCPSSTRVDAVEDEVRRQQNEWHSVRNMHRTASIVDPAPVPALPRSPRHIYLERLLANDPTLCTLDLTNSHFNDASIQPVLVTLPTNTHVKYLILDRNQLGDRSAVALAEVLGQNVSLCRLSLQSNCISPAGALALINAMAQSRTLHEMSLQSNDIATGTMQDLLRKFPSIAMAADGTLNRKPRPQNTI